MALRDAMNAETSALYAPRTAELDAEQRAAVDEVLATRDDEFVATVVAFDGDAPAGHAALRPAPGEPEGTLEVKKVFVPVQFRGRGVSKLLMSELEAIALGRGATRLVLQTGNLQTEAVSLYEAIGYRAIPPYGGYGVIPATLCFEKILA
ncbi:MAG: family N-acetyltransferase [Rhodoglobus sp.]|nr:family N-acetyltransferase [Rhodoglobus sp.]